jgi:hypothetical protein
MVQSIEITDAQPRDIPPMVDILRAAFIDAHTGLTPELTPEALADHMDDMWTEKKLVFFDNALHDTNRSIIVARLGNATVGYCIGRSDRKNGSLQVLPEAQGIVGPQLLGAIACRVAIDQPYILHTAPGSRAERMYRRIGFTPTGRNLSASLPRIKNGATIPQIELVIMPEQARAAAERFQALLSRRQRIHQTV